MALIGIKRRGERNADVDLCLLSSVSVYLTRNSLESESLAVHVTIYYLIIHNGKKLFDVSLRVVGSYNGFNIENLRFVSKLYCFVHGFEL